MMEKSYWLGYNRYSKIIIVYSTEADAIRSGTWYRLISAHTLADAQKEFQRLYDLEN